MPHLRSITFTTPSGATVARYPFTVPALRALQGQTLTLTSPVTMFVGENGSGKSTVLEGLARAIGCITVGSQGAEQDTSLGHIGPLADSLKLVWNRKTRRGFFMR